MFLHIKKMIAINMAVIFFVGLDRFFKIFALANRTYEFNLFGEILKFNYTPNYYIAFSLPLAGQALEILIALIILALIWLWLKTFLRRNYVKLTALTAIILGAGSNLFDRLKYGYVIDYLDLKYFTVFNLADVMIVAGVILLLFKLDKKSSRLSGCFGLYQK